MFDRKDYFPLSTQGLSEIASLIFSPIKRNESVTTIWVPMSGRRIVTKYILENISLFKKALPDYQKYLLVYIEPLELTEETIRGYFRLLGKTLGECCLKRRGCQEKISKKCLKVFEKENLSYAKILDEVSLLIRKIVDKDFKIIFFIGEFDELSFANTIFYNNLKHLWLKFFPSLQFVFLNREEALVEEKIGKFGDLNEVLLQNVIYIPMFRSEVQYLIDRFSYQLGRSFSQKERDLIVELCGWHPYMIKVATRFLTQFNGQKIKLNELERQLLRHYELNSVARSIFEAQTEGHKAVLKKIAFREPKLPLDESSLEKLEIIYQDNSGRWRVFSKIFENICLEKEEPAYIADEKGDLLFDRKSGVVLFHGKPIEEKFSSQEYNVLVSFLKEPDVLKKRDEIGEILWGKDSFDRYSDWAIDQLISKLRKKLKKLNTKGKLTTLRGRGYKFITD